ncbi:MAG: CheR family methyltransferase, partial [Flavisolibacter sp.]
MDAKHIPSENLFPVVGVGASAGGLEAFKELIKAIPTNSGMAYIFIQHLAPHHESLLTEILQKFTTIPVVEISNNLKVLPNHVYIIPANKLVTANDGVLQLEPRIEKEKLNVIDVFFSSLAEVHQDHAIGIILSGTGSDGTVGLKTIKDLGGITIVQDKDSATYYGMPQSAIDAEVVDSILPPGKIPSYLDQLAKTSGTIPSDFAVSESNEEEIFQQILHLLRSKRGVDFTYYKQTTIRRRILRRKGLNNIATLREYQVFLIENKSEQDALFKDILIPVTSFFRDPKTFDVLCEKAFPVLFKEKKETDVIRLWCAGCSTGEEAYSLAICLHEYFGTDIIKRKIQIFATDISEAAIAKARSGVYQKTDLAGVSEERLKDFFTKKDGSYQVDKSIREICVFATQNFLKDPPFAKMDLISCRNVLIYMESHLQKKALATFHYALNPDGFLFLGRSETTGQSSDKFKAFSKYDKIYTKTGTTSKYMPVETERNEDAFKRKDENLKKSNLRKNDFQKATDDALLSKYNSVGVVINQELNIIQFRGATAPYLEAPPGRASHNILKMAKEGLSFELRNAIHKASLTNANIRKEGIAIDKGKRKVSIDVIPLQNTIEPYFLVLFEESPEHFAEKPQKGKGGKNKEQRSGNEMQRIEQLESELLQAREDMRAITEEQEAANEELQSANEELLSGSEELQTLNEELVTSKEEIQSTNEELTTLNQELMERNEQLVNARRYAEAIVSTIHEPLVILTKNLKIKSANKCFYEKFNVTEQQTEGKDFLEWANGIWNVPELERKLKKVLPERTFFEDLELDVSSYFKTEKIMLLNARQVANETSNEPLILVAMQDITERKLLERKEKSFSEELEREVIDRTKELRTSNLNLQYSNESLDQFASIASHDLQEPLRKIQTFASLLKGKFESSLSQDGKEMINKINVAADRMSQLIKEVRQYSKVVYTPRIFKPTNLDGILKNVLSDLELRIIETKATIHYEESLPVIDALPLQINQLFYNLLTNALKFYKEPSTPVVVIAYRYLESEELVKFPNLDKDIPHIEIKFTDNGIGFEQQFADQIFQIFERLHPADEFDGTGIGLALCKKIIENHHGHIYALSNENEGASFIIILPIKQTQ